MVKHVMTKEQNMCLFIYKIVHLYPESLLAQNKFEDEKMALCNYQNVAKITVWGGNTTVKWNVSIRCLTMIYVVKKKNPFQKGINPPNYVAKALKFFQIKRAEKAI